MSLIDLAVPFGTFRDVGGQVTGYWPLDAYETAADEDGRPTVLYHKTFDPLTETEADGVGRPWLAAFGGLPAVFRRFLTTCSNGLEFASGDLMIFGHRRRVALDPESGFGGAGLPGKMSMKFGRWGRELLWLDLQQGSVGTVATGSRYLREWPTFPAFLVAACGEHSASFDREGRRIGFASLPTPGRPPDSLSFVPSEFLSRASEVLRLLAKAPRRVKAGGIQFEPFDPNELPARQIGYGIDAEGKPMGGEPGAWMQWWLAVGIDPANGDPLAVDLSTQELSVFTARHGQGQWEPVKVADSLQSLIGR